MKAYKNYIAKTVLEFIDLSIEDQKQWKFDLLDWIQDSLQGDLENGLNLFKNMNSMDSNYANRLLRNLESIAIERNNLEKKEN